MKADGHCDSLQQDLGRHVNGASVNDDRTFAEFLNSY